MITALALAAVMNAQTGPLPGADKVKHFFVSAFLQSVAFSVARTARMERSNAHLAAGVITLAVGVSKEVFDRRRGGNFSAADLGWDAAGALAAGAILNGTR